MKKIESEEDYAALNALPQAILFVDSLWSLPLNGNRNNVERWEAENFAVYGLQVYVADCDVKTYLSWISTLHDSLKLLSGALSPQMIVWLRYGSYISAMYLSRNRELDIVPELTSKTRELFGLDEN